VTTSDSRGRLAELAAALLLRLKGFEILSRRFATAVGEIDIVARRGDLLVFVEVKRRPTVIAALDAVTPRQRLRVARAASLFLKARPAMRRHRCRFDVVAVTPRRWPRHLPDAWRL
jgi:putative endonuclease